jgi:hypothetical protein
VMDDLVILERGRLGISERGTFFPFQSFLFSIFFSDLALPGTIEWDLLRNLADI